MAENTEPRRRPGLQFRLGHFQVPSLALDSPDQDWWFGGEDKQVIVKAGLGEGCQQDNVGLGQGLGGDWGEAENPGPSGEAGRLAGRARSAGPTHWPPSQGTTGGFRAGEGQISSTSSRVRLWVWGRAPREAVRWFQAEAGGPGLCGTAAQGSGTGPGLDSPVCRGTEGASDSTDAVGGYSPTRHPCLQSVACPANIGPYHPRGGELGGHAWASSSGLWERRVPAWLPWAGGEPLWVPSLGSAPAPA